MRFVCSSKILFRVLKSLERTPPVDTVEFDDNSLKFLGEGVDLELYCPSDTRSWKITYNAKRWNTLKNILSVIDEQPITVRIDTNEWINVEIIC